jgi:hypothetical protein
MLRVTVARGGQVIGPAIDLPDGEVRIGSAPDAGLRLPAADAEAEHAVLTHGAGMAPRLEVRAAMRLGAGALGAGTRLPLTLPATLGIGACELTVELSSAQVASGVVRTASLARELVRQLLSAEAAPGASAVELLIERGPGVGERRPLRLGRTTLGRGDDADWPLLDPDLSRHHAAVERTWDGVTVEDLGSKNGTRVDGALVGAGPVALPVGGSLELGQTMLRLVDPAELALRVTRPRLAAVPPTEPTPGPATPPPRRPAGPAFWIAAVLALTAGGALAYVLLG